MMVKLHINHLEKIFYYDSRMFIILFLLHLIVDLHNLMQLPPSLNTNKFFKIYLGYRVYRETCFKKSIIALLLILSEFICFLFYSDKQLDCASRHYNGEYEKLQLVLNIKANRICTVCLV